MKTICPGISDEQAEVEMKDIGDLGKSACTTTARNEERNKSDDLGKGTDNNSCDVEADDDEDEDDSDDYDDDDDDDDSIDDRDSQRLELCLQPTIQTNTRV
jgi:ribonuclease E